MYAEEEEQPEEEEEGVEILAAEPQPIRKIQSQEFKLLEVNGESEEGEAEGDQVSVKEDTDAAVEPEAAKEVKKELAFEETEKLTQEAFDAITAAAEEKKKAGGENIAAWADSASDNWAEADEIPVKKASPRIPGQGDEDDLDEADAPKVELESRIVTEVLSADLNPFNITEDSEKN